MYRTLGIVFLNSRSNNRPPPKRCPPHRPYMYICNIKQVPLVNKLSLPQGWRYSGFQVIGMIEWGQKSIPNEIPGASNKSPPKNPWPKINPPKIPCEFLSLKNLQKALNNITQKIWTIEIECLCLFIHHTIIYRLFWICPKIPYLHRATQEKCLPNFSTPKSLRG